MNAPIDSRMQPDSKIWVAGHRGLVGSALTSVLHRKGYTNRITRTHAELDLTDAAATEAFFAAERPEYVFLAAAKVGGILANDTYPAEFIRENLAIQTNVIHLAWKYGEKRLLFLGSSCIYPKHAPQPLKEEYLLTGPLEPTNRPYALAKIAGVEMCWSYNRQYGTRFLGVMPTNLYGPGDNYDLNTSHVIPALIRKFHEAKEYGQSEVVIWGTGSPRREFLYSEDMAEACAFLMELPDGRFSQLIGTATNNTEDFSPPLVNIGVGEDISIIDLAKLIRETVGYSGALTFDRSKPDGTPRKLMDVSRINQAGWKAVVTLPVGLAATYELFLSRK